MGTLNVKVPDEMEDELIRYMKENPGYMNRSELVRDALRHLISQSKPSRPEFSIFSVPGITPRSVYEHTSQQAQQRIAENGIEQSEVENAIEWARENPDPWTTDDHE